MFFKKIISNYTSLDYVAVIAFICLVCTVGTFFHQGFVNDQINTQINNDITGKLIDVQVSVIATRTNAYLIFPKLQEASGQIKIITTYSNNLQITPKVINAGEKIKKTISNPLQK